MFIYGLVMIAIVILGFRKRLTEPGCDPGDTDTKALANVSAKVSSGTMKSIGPQFICT